MRRDTDFSRNPLRVDAPPQNLLCGPPLLAAHIVGNEFVSGLLLRSVLHLEEEPVVALAAEPGLYEDVVAFQTFPLDHYH